MKVRERRKDVFLLSSGEEHESPSADLRVQRDTECGRYTCTCMMGRVRLWDTHVHERATFTHKLPFLEHAYYCICTSALFENITDCDAVAYRMTV